MFLFRTGRCLQSFCKTVPAAQCQIGLELLKMQSGVYLGEGDIVRLQNRYGRVETPLKAIPNALEKCKSMISIGDSSDSGIGDVREGINHEK